MTATLHSPVAPTQPASLPEGERNRLLRRVDWRFLGGMPTDPVSVCYGDASLSRAVATIASRLVEPHDADDSGGCDLAVAVNPDAATLRRAWSALRPGGTCYTEWTRARAGGPWAIRRRLARGGWVSITCHAPRPDPASATPRVWLPLDSTPALRFFFRHQPRATSLPRRFARTARRLLWLSGGAARFSRPICVVARKSLEHASASAGAGTNTPRTAMPADFAAELLTLVRDHWEAWGLGPTPRRPSLLLQTGGPRSVSKVVGFVFGDRGHEPALVIKLPREAASRATLRREADVLEALGPRAGIPRLLFSTSSGGVLAVGETIVRGVPLVALDGPPRYEQLAHAATEWLGEFAERTTMTWSDESYARLVEAPLADFVAAFGRVLDPGMVRETEARLRALAGVPLVCEHRDFSPWNAVLAPSGELGVLDWEGAELRGLPALDLVYFLTYWGFFVDRAEDLSARVTSYRAALDPGTRTGATSRECLDRYCAHLGIPGTLLPALRLLVWLVHSRSEYRRFTEDAAGTPSATSLKRSLFVALWREELREVRLR
jgi:hypothetical protein